MAFDTSLCMVSLVRPLQQVPIPTAWCCCPLLFIREHYVVLVVSSAAITTHTSTHRRHVHISHRSSSVLRWLLLVFLHHRPRSPASARCVPAAPCPAWRVEGVLLQHRGAELVQRPGPQHHPAGVLLHRGPGLGNGLPVRPLSSARHR